LISFLFSGCSAKRRNGSNGDNIEQEIDLIEDLRLARLCFATNPPNWKDASEGDKLIKPKYEAFSAGQKFALHHLITLLLRIMDDETGCDRLEDGLLVSGMNWATWIRILLHVISLLDPSMSESHDNCWLLKKGRRKKEISFNVGKVCKMKDNSKWKFLSINAELNSFARLMAILQSGRNAQGGEQGSHLCKNYRHCKGTDYFNHCVNPSHHTIENGKDNMGRNGCDNGAQYHCPHDPIKCVITDKFGRYLPHRNVKSIEEAAACGCVVDGIAKYCHNAEIVLSAEELEEDAVSLRKVFIH
jgi:hypothetical protein